MSSNETKWADDENVLTTATQYMLTSNQNITETACSYLSSKHSDKSFECMCYVQQNQSHLIICQIALDETLRLYYYYIMTFLLILFCNRIRFCSAS